MVANVCPEGQSPAKWDLDALSALVRDQFNLEVRFSGPPSSRAKEARAQIEEQIWNVVSKAYEAKEGELGVGEDGVPVLRRWEQYVYLQAIDALWKDHLLAMDHLRQGIGLRGYGQKDPKQEYKKEGYEAFTQMTWRVKSAVIGNLLRLQLVRQESAEEIERKRLALARKTRMVETHGAETDGEAREIKPETVVRATPKVGRNDPCPCGSGKKYKKCHGATEATA